MPTYDYTCDACNHEFERVQRITEKPLKKCPKCGKLKARRMIGGGGFILKGGGWESDLYSGASNRPSSPAKSSETSDSSSSSSSSEGGSSDGGSSKSGSSGSSSSD